MPNLHENDFYNYCDWIGEAIPDYYTIYGLFRLVHSGDRRSEILFSLRPRSAGFADHEVPRFERSLRASALPRPGSASLREIAEITTVE